MLEVRVEIQKIKSGKRWVVYRPYITYKESISHYKLIKKQHKLAPIPLLMLEHEVYLLF